MGDAMHHGDRAAMREQWRKAHQERRARFLHDVLNIRPDQEAALQAFLADTQRQPHEHKDWAQRDGQAAAPMTTPQRLDQMAAMMAKRSAERQAAFQRRADAVKRFYAVLSPEQKRAFDALHERGCMDGHGHHGGPGPNSGRGGGPRDQG
jgi:Spy/CpxP family protein refolding chaperone